MKMNGHGGKSLGGLQEAVSQVAGRTLDLTIHGRPGVEPCGQWPDIYRTLDDEGKLAMRKTFASLLELAYVEVCATIDVPGQVHAVMGDTLRSIVDQILPSPYRIFRP